MYLNTNVTKLLLRILICQTNIRMPSSPYSNNMLTERELNKRESQKFLGKQFYVSLHAKDVKKGM